MLKTIAAAKDDSRGKVFGLRRRDRHSKTCWRWSILAGLTAEAVAGMKAAQAVCKAGAQGPARKPSYRPHWRPRLRNQNASQLIRSVTGRLVEGRARLSTEALARMRLRSPSP